MAKIYILTETDLQNYGVGGVSNLWVFNTQKDAQDKMMDLFENSEWYKDSTPDEMDYGNTYAYISQYIYYDIFEREIGI